MAKRKTIRKGGKSVSKKPKTRPSKPAVAVPLAEATRTGNEQPAEKSPRLIPKPDELKSLYQRYTNGAAFDDHDKAFYFVLDVGGLNRAKQLLDHVGEVLAELEELQ